MDEYAKEIEDLEAQVAAMVEAEDDPHTIRDLTMQIEVLQAIYRQAGALWARGRADPGLRRGLAVRGYGEWTLDSVYAFVYESAIDLPGDGHRAFVESIRGADFGGPLGAIGGTADLN
ncbi:MAG: hypothetical protein ACREPA_05320 [Candidatus Dormibacteraceae bacterium]